MSAPDRERGAALVVTLIFVTAMAAAAVAFMAGRRTDALTLRGQLQSVEAQAMLDAALQQTVVLLANKTPRQTVPGQLSWRFGDVAVRVRLQRESGKIDLNSAPDPMLRALPLALGLDEDRAVAFADVVQDWRDDNQLKLEQGAEDRDYRGGDTGAGGAADRPFANPAELRYLPVIDRAVWEMVQPHITVYSGAAEPKAPSATGLVRQAIRIARGLKANDPEPNDSDSQEGDGGVGNDGQGDGTFGSDGDEGGSQGKPAIGSTLSRRTDSDQRDQGGMGAGDRGGLADRGNAGAEGGGSGGGAGGADESGPQTVLLGVRFPNGYEAAAKAVIALAGGGTGGPAFVVLDWTPILGARGDGL